MSGDWFVGADIGGTFTDIVAVSTGGELVHLKVPSSREDPASGVIRGLQALQQEAGVACDRIQLLLHGTTLATNAIIERRLARTALVTTAGFRDVLEIGRHWRKELYDPFIDQPAPLVTRDLRFEVAERLAANGEELEPLDADGACRVVEELHEADVEAVAVVFLHSYRDPRHEQEMSELLRARNSWFVCGSAELSRELREYERTSTTVLNVALMPLIDEYLTRLERGLEKLGYRGSLFVTQSNGGALTPRGARARPVSLALSGPVGGVVACVELGKAIGRGELIGFDMGGTSTDVSIVSGHEPRYSTELTIGELPVRLPSVQVLSIGAGGGSIAAVDAGGALRVGPESAGSTPGPACYGHGGTEATVTDCQLVLGRLTEEVPLAGRLALSLERARSAVERGVAAKLGLGVEEAAAGVIEVANAAMERAVRVALRDRGDDPREFALVAFGGAGPLHAVELARRLSVATVVVPPHPGTLSALGFLETDVRLDFAASELHRSDEPDLPGAIAAVFSSLEEHALAEIAGDGNLDETRVELERSCDIRYLGQAYEVNVPLQPEQPTPAAVEDMLDEFHRLHERAYAFASRGEPCELVTLRVSARVPLDKPPLDRVAASGPSAPPADRLVYQPGAGLVATAVYQRAALAPGARVDGPAIVHQDDTTTLIPPFASAVVDAAGNLILTVEDEDER